MDTIEAQFVALKKIVDYFSTTDAFFS